MKQARYSGARWISGYARSIDTWTLAHRCYAMALFAALAFTAGRYVYPVPPAAELRARHAAIEALEARLQSAVQTAAAQRDARPARVPPAPAAHLGDVRADDTHLLQRLSPALEVKDLTLDAFEPGETRQTAHGSARRVQLQVSGAFPALANFTARLATLPFPALPETAQLHAQGQRHRLALSLGVMEMQMEDFQTLAHKEEKMAILHRPLPDPFGAARALRQTGSDSRLPQLIGVLQRGRARAALVQSSTGVQMLRTGDILEGMKIQRIEETALWLSDGATVRRTLVLRAPETASQKLPQPRLRKTP